MNEEENFCCLCGDGKSVSFKTKQELQEHFREHGKKRKTGAPTTSGKGKPADSKTIECDVCSATFRSVTDAINHKFKAHPESSNSHFCPFCGKRFPLKTSKDIHMRFEHSKEKKEKKNLKCECGEQFYTDHAINYHIQSFHKRSNSIVMSEVEVMPASKKIKKNVSGELVSVYYCHFCGAEYLVKFNLKSHIESIHQEDSKKEKPGQLIKCSLCASVFYNKKAYDNHNLLHKPDDLYIATEKHRALTVSRIDCDLDIARIPSLWDKLQTSKRPRIKKIKSGEALKEQGLSGSDSSERLANNPVDTNEETKKVSNTSRPSDIDPPQSSESTSSSTIQRDALEERKSGKNRALVDSDSENNDSDSSDEERNEVEKIDSESQQTASKDQDKDGDLVKIDENNDVEILPSNEERHEDKCDSEKKNQRMDLLVKQSERINKRVLEPGRKTVTLTELKHATMSLSFLNQSSESSPNNKRFIFKEISTGKRKLNHSYQKTKIVKGISEDEKKLEPSASTDIAHSK